MNDLCIVLSSNGYACSILSVLVTFSIHQDFLALLVAQMICTMQCKAMHSQFESLLRVEACLQLPWVS